MYRLTVEGEFDASHALAIRGERETAHGHRWRVRLTLGGPRLDNDGLLCDFHDLQEVLGGVLRPWHGGHLNALPPFDKVNPSAENVARIIGERVQPSLPPGVRIVSVRVTEAPGCAAECVFED